MNDRSAANPLDSATARAKMIDQWWNEARALAEALESRTRFATRQAYLDSDERLLDLETKASAMAQAIHDIRLVRRLA